MERFVIIIVRKQELARIIAKMLFHQYGIPTYVVDDSDTDGYRVMAEMRYSEMGETLTGFAEGVFAVLGRFFSL